MHKINMAGGWTPCLRAELAFFTRETAPNVLQGDNAAGARAAHVGMRGARLLAAEALLW